MAQPYRVEARSTATFGRVLASARNQHFVIDGPVGNGCPGEAVTPAEAFLAGVAACGVELLQVIARDRELPLETVHLTIDALVDRDRPVRTDLTLFNSVRLAFALRGVTREEGVGLVEAFKGR